MGILWNIGELIMTCIDVVYFLSLPIFQMRCKEWVKEKHIILYGIFILTIITIYNHFTSNSFLVIFLSLTLLSIYSFVFIQGQWLLKIFWVAFPFALLYGIELMTFSFLTYVHSQINIDVFALQNTYRLQMLICSKSLQIMLLIFLLNTKLHLENFSYIILLPVTALSIVGFSFLLYNHLYGLTELDKPIAQTLLYQFALAFLFINFGYLLLIAWLNRKHEKTLYQQQKLSAEQLQTQQVKLQQMLNQKLLLQQVELKLKSHEELSAAHEKFKKFQDDVKENLQSLWSLAKIHKIPQFEMYLTQVSHINQQFETLYQTGDDVLDTVLSSKEAVANLQYIDLQAKVHLAPSSQIISSIDLGTILINLLDNSIEALQNLIPADGLERIINLTMDIDDLFYKIEIKNPSDGREQRSQEELTTLSSFQNTGLGLKIVKGLVDKYHGTLRIINKDFNFVVLILLPLSPKPSEIEEYYAGKDRVTIDSFTDQ